MRIERLFNVLVLGGAALSGACSDAKEQDEDAEELGRGDGGAASGAGGADATGGATETVAAGGAASGAGGTDATGGAGSGGDGAGGGATGPECTTGGNAFDPCGCPCCWANDDCTNDEPCCAVFCASGNDGEGCCPP